MPLIQSERYEIAPIPIGQGGFGEVYRALDLLTEETVVIKTILASHLYGINEPEIRRKFFREAVVSARLGAHCQNIVAVRDFGYDRDSSMPFFVMEYIDGTDIFDFVGEMNGRSAVNVLFQMLLALDAAHKSGVIHSDISPDNILAEEVTGFLKLTDFGLARLLTSQIASKGRSYSLVGGKPGYLPPLDWQTGNRTVHSDLFGLAATIVQLVSGQLPQYKWSSGILTGPTLIEQFTNGQITTKVVDAAEVGFHAVKREQWDEELFLRKITNKDGRVVLFWRDIVECLQVMLDDEAGTVGAIIDQLRQASARNLASGRKKPIKKDAAKKPKQQS